MAWILSAVFFSNGAIKFDVRFIRPGHFYKFELRPKFDRTIVVTNITAPQNNTERSFIVIVEKFSFGHFNTKRDARNEKFIGYLIKTSVIWLSIFKPIKLVKNYSIQVIFD